MRRANRWMLGLMTALVVAIVLSLLIGRVWLDPRQIVQGFWSPAPQLAAMIVTDLRLPRTVLACIAGATLGLSGAVLQGLTRNPLAEPGLLGVTTGAALGAVIAIYFGISSLSLIAGPLLGILGALIAGALTFALGERGGTLALILAGTAVSGLTTALIAVALNLAPNPYAAYEIMSWLMGSLADRSWSQVLLILPFATAGVILLLTTGRGLDALSLGEVQARSLGINLGRLRLAALGGTALAAGAVTSVTGAIGFVGLVAPHLTRTLIGARPRSILVPASALGALFLLTADIATRLIRIGPEIKLGVLTSLVGTPFFFWLVIRLRRLAQ